MMKRMLFVLLLVGLLVAVLAMPAAAAEPDVYHCACGEVWYSSSSWRAEVIRGSKDNCLEGCDGSNKTWKPLTDTASLPTSGNYYLDNDVELTSPCVLPAWYTLSIDLNGKTISANGAQRLFVMSNQHSKLILTDTSDDNSGRLDYSKVTTGEGWGLAILLNSNTTVNMYGGTVSGTKEAGTGGACVAISSSAGSNATFNLYGGTLTGGYGGRWGGNVLLHTGVFNMYDGEISGGSAGMYESTKPGGGNIYVNAAAKLNIYGGTVSGGSAPMGTSVVVYGQMTMSGGTITGAADVVNTGAVHVRGNGTLKVSGTARIVDNMGANVYLAGAESFADATGTTENFTSRSLTVSGTLTGTAPSMGITLQDHTDPRTDSRVFTSSTQSAYFVSDSSDFKVKATDDGLVLTKAADFKLNGTGALKSFADCVQEASFANKDFVQLQFDVDAITVMQDVYLDLNGHTVGTVDIAQGVTLYAFDSATKSYDATNRGYILEKTGDGKFKDAFVNSEQHRYLTLKEAGGYSFHRFYLAVTHTVISNGFDGMRFKVTLKCSDMVAEAINSQGGDFGIHLKVNGNDPIPMSFKYDAKIEVLSGENTAILGTENSQTDKMKAYMEADQKCNAYITVNGEEILSAVKTRNMKQMILSVIEEQWDTELDVLQRDMMGKIYRNYGTDIGMDAWGDLITKKLKPGAGPVVRNDCVCGDKAATGTPCATGGHQSVSWTGVTNASRFATPGYYRLDADVTLTGKVTVSGNVVIDLNGHKLHGVYGTRMFEVSGSGAALTLADHKGGGMVIPAPGEYLSNELKNGIVVSVNNGTFNMYAGIIKLTGVTSSYGLAVEISGGAVVNMYGGAITGGTTQNGGLVMVYPGQFNMYGGIVEGGIQTKNGGNSAYYGGGNIRISNHSGSVFNMYGGIIRNGKSTTDYGGNIHNQWQVNLYGGTVTGGSAAYSGGGIYNNGTLMVQGEPVVAGNQGSDVYLGGGKKIDISSAGLGDGASIGVYATQFSGAFTSAANATADNAKGFFSCASSIYSVKEGANGLVMVGYDGYSVGYAAMDISPTADMFGKVGMPGYGTESSRLVSSVDKTNPPKAVCLAVADGKGGIAILVSLDAAAIDSNMAKQITANIMANHGIPEQKIMFSSNHQHSVPSGGAYSNLLQAQIIAGINAAIGDMKPVTAMDAQTVDLSGNPFTFVRNFQYLDENGKPIPGAMYTANHDDKPRLGNAVSTNRMAYESQADNNVRLVRITRDGGKQIMLANFQTHPLLYTSSTSTQVHADIVGKFRNALEEQTGCLPMYFNGAAGNLHPFSPIEAGKSSVALASRNRGAELATAVTEIMNNGTWTDVMGSGEAKVQTLTYTHTYDLRPTADDVPQWLMDANPGKTQTELAQKMLARAKAICPAGDNNWQSSYTTADLTQYGLYSQYHAKHLVLRNLSYERKGITTQERDNSVITFGDVAFAVASFEMFDENGMEIRAASPYGMTFVATMACMPHSTNGHKGDIARYIPSQRGFDNGGYSADICHYAAGTGEKVRDNIVSMLRETKSK